MVRTVLILLVLVLAGMALPEEATEATLVGFECPVDDIADTQCEGPKDCLYPHPENCNQFIHCEVNADGQTGRPSVKDCPAESEWNDNKRECDWPKDSTCGSKPDADNGKD